MWKSFILKPLWLLRIILINMSPFSLMTEARIKHLNDCIAFLIRMGKGFRFCRSAETLAKRQPFMPD